MPERKGVWSVPRNQSVMWLLTPEGSPGPR